MLADFVGLASATAAVALNAGRDAYHALKLLELGRGIIANLLMDMRGDISDLKQRQSGLADELVSLQDELDSPADSPFPSVPSTLSRLRTGPTKTASPLLSHATSHLVIAIVFSQASMHEFNQSTLC
jgi:hypothetical protein